MKRETLDHLLSGNPYPGRGIVLGKHADGEHAVAAYFIMGRSENSRNRVFVESADNGIRTQAFDPSKLSDPSLIIYAPVRVKEGITIVTNGDQTDTISSFLNAGKTFEQALRTRTFEPDAPNYTPRISGILGLGTGGFGYKLSILKSGNGAGEGVRRQFFEYLSPIAGEGHFIHTYRCDGNPIPSFEGEPVPVEIDGDHRAFTERIWESLNEENKVSLFTRYINMYTGETETFIVNKNID